MHEDICDSEAKMVLKLQWLVMNFIHTRRYSNFILKSVILKGKDLSYCPVSHSLYQHNLKSIFIS